ncbi:MAG: helix-turn-helix domain-containing protein [Salinisphaera sp.]|nr:helix-turn-helix domain-containing protein [Salinisphaera sp.]
MKIKTPQELGLLIRERRNRLGWSQQALAEKTGLRQPWISALETGNANAQLSKVLTLLCALKITLDLSTPDMPAVPPALNRPRPDNTLLDRLIDAHRVKTSDE